MMRVTMSRQRWARPIPVTLAMIGATYIDRMLRFLLLTITGWAAGPSGLGVALLALLVTELVQTLTDLGFHRSLLQEKRLRRATVDTAFTLAACNGFVIAAVMLAFAGPLASLMGEPRIEPLLRLLAIVPVVTGLGQVSDALLQRRKRFRLIAARTVATAVAASGVGFGAIRQGSPDYALVLSALVQACLVGGLSWVLAPYRPRPRPSGDEWKRIGPRSFRLWMSGIVGFLNNRGFDFIAGLSLGPAALAALRIGGQIVLLLIQVTIGPILAVAYAVLPRLRGQPDRFKAELMVAALLCSALLFPIFAGLFALADVVLPAVLGEKWNSLAAILPFMSLIAPALYYHVIMSAAFFGSDRNDLLLKISIFELIATIVVGAIGSNFGIIGIAAAGSLRVYLLIPLTWRWMSRDVGFNPKILVLIALPALISTAVMLAALMIIKPVVIGSFSSYWWQATIMFSVGVISYAVLMSAFVFVAIRHHKIAAAIFKDELAADLSNLRQSLTLKIRMFNETDVRQRGTTSP